MTQTNKAKPPKAGKTPKELVIKHLAADQLELLQLARSLKPEDWNKPSLCEDWQIRDVIAHVIVSNRQWYNPGPGAALRKRRQLPTPELIKELEESLKIGRVMSLLPTAFLYENWVHQQDIRWQLGPEYQRTQDQERMRILLDYRKGYAAKKFKQIRFEALDLDWSCGSGELRTGSAEAIIMALAGRPAGLNRLNPPPMGLG